MSSLDVSRWALWSNSNPLRRASLTPLYYRHSRATSRKSSSKRWQARQGRDHLTLQAKVQGLKSVQCPRNPWTARTRTLEFCTDISHVFPTNRFQISQVNKDELILIRRFSQRAAFKLLEVCKKYPWSAFLS